ncbi:tyrosine-type recombinase/integrase [Devosia sp. A449]
MGYCVKNLYLIGNRWKYRKGIPALLRPHIDGRLTEFVRWLGAHEGTSKNPPPGILSRYSEVDKECSALIAMAKKRADGHFDELNAEVIAHVITQARHELLEADDIGRFDPDVLNHGKHWEKRQETIDIVLPALKREYALGQIGEFTTDEVLDRCASLGLLVDTQSDGFRKLARAYLGLLIETTEKALQRQSGEPVPTPEPPPPIAPHAARKPSKQTITGLATDWWKEASAAGRSLSTKEAYTRAARQLSEFLGHDDANAVTNTDILAFKDHRIAQGKNLKTIGAGDLSALNVLFGWGVSNKRLAVNPVEGVKVMAPKKTRSRGPGFTDEEASAILSASWAYQPAGKEPHKTTLAKRWVPLLMAYTGARVGEMAQLRREDVRLENGRWIIKIDPEAGTVKTDEYREVVMHPHLVELGFPTFAQQAKPGHLFLTITRDGPEGIRGALQTLKNDLRDFARTIVSDPRVQPNHGWRHRFSTVSGDLGKREDVQCAITGHQLKGGSRMEYGERTFVAMEKFFSDWPRVEITD